MTYVSDSPHEGVSPPRAPCPRGGSQFRVGWGSAPGVHTWVTGRTQTPRCEYTAKYAASTHVGPEYTRAVSVSTQWGQSRFSWDDEIWYALRTRTHTAGIMRRYAAIWYHPWIQLH